jgi:hypothetical protein
MTFRHFFTFVGILLALALVPVAQAANLFIDDSVEAQITLTHDRNWEGGVVSNGFPFGPRVPGSTTVSGESATFSGTWLVNNPGNPDPGNGIIYFVDEVVVNDDDDDDDDDDGNNVRLVVSDIVTAEWSTVVRPGLLLDIATITFRIQSSGCGQNLGPLPPHFAGHGVPDPPSPIEISGLFRHPATAAPVAIPSNLTVQFVGKLDTACPGDGGDDDEDDEDDDDDDDDDDEDEDDD